MTFFCFRSAHRSHSLLRFPGRPAERGQRTGTVKPQRQLENRAGPRVEIAQESQLDHGGETAEARGETGGVLHEFGAATLGRQSGHQREARGENQRAADRLEETARAGESRE